MRNRINKAVNHWPLTAVMWYVFHTQAECVVRLCTKFEADWSIHSKVIRGSRNYELRSRDPGHVHLGVVLWSLRREAPSCMSVANLKRIALFVQKLLRGPICRPAADPFPGLQDHQNLISSRWSLPATTHPVWLKSMNAISSYRGNSHGPPARPPARCKHTQPQTGPITIHCAAASSRAV